jgi:RNA polymerase-binding transcription factor DksA
MTEQTAEFERHADTLAALTTGPRRHATDQDRAIAALRLFSAREAIERVEDALARVDDGSYALCQSCGRRIPPTELEEMPHARLCAECSTDSLVKPAFTGVSP